MSSLRYTFDEICRLPAHVHEELFLRGSAPRLSELSGWEFRGMNGGRLPPLLGIRRFIKGFRASERDDTLDGYNLWAKQTRTPSAPWQERDPRPHGFYKVMPASASASDHRYPHALLLDYGLGDNPWTHPGRFLRDYLVQIYPDDPKLLIGKAYVALGPLRIFGSHFVLERIRRAG